MPKVTSQAEAILNSEKTKPMASAIGEFCWSEGISYFFTKPGYRTFFL